MKIHEHLAIIADIVTILGISFVWLIGTPLAQVFLGRKLHVFDLLNGVLFYSVFICSSIILIIVFSKGIYNSYIQRKFFYSVFQFLFFVLSLSFLAGIFEPTRDVWANLLENEYLFPISPSAVIERIDVNFNAKEDIVTGKITWKPQYSMNIDDYRVMVYTSK